MRDDAVRTLASRRAAHLAMAKAGKSAHSRALQVEFYTLRVGKLVLFVGPPAPSRCASVKLYWGRGQIFVLGQLCQNRALCQNVITF